MRAEFVTDCQNRIRHLESNAYRNVEVSQERPELRFSVHFEDHDSPAAVGETIPKRKERRSSRRLRMLER